MHDVEVKLLESATTSVLLRDQAQPDIGHVNK